MTTYAPLQQYIVINCFHERNAGCILDLLTLQHKVVFMVGFKKAKAFPSAVGLATYLLGP